MSRDPDTARDARREIMVLAPGNNNQKVMRSYKQWRRHADPEDELSTDLEVGDVPLQLHHQSSRIMLPFQILFSVLVFF